MQGTPPPPRGFPPTHLQEHDVLWKALNGLEEQPLETQAGPAVGVALFQELHKPLLLVDGLLQHRHCNGEVVDGGGIVLDDILGAKLVGRDGEKAKVLFWGELEATAKPKHYYSGPSLIRISLI